jgi:hypothetical protein
MTRSLAKQGEPSSGANPGSRQRRPSKGHRREKAARGLLEVKQAPRAPMPRKTLERHEPLARDDVNPRRDIDVRRSLGARLM